MNEFGAIRRKGRPAALAAVVALALVPASASADTVVDCSGLAVALAAATDGEVITLQAGQTCHEAYTLPQKPGPGPFSITLQGGGSGATLDGSLEPGNRVLTGEVGPGNVLDVTIRNLAFQDSTSPSGESGGALLLTGNVGVTVEQDRFVGNRSAGAGGGVFVASTSTKPTTIASSTFGSGAPGSGNSSAGDGGGIAVHNVDTGPSVAVNSTTFYGNHSDARGGGLAAIAYGAGDTVDVTGSDFVANTSRTGGGGAKLIGGDTAVRGSTFNGNGVTPTADGVAKGGGLDVESADTDRSLDQSDNEFGGNSIHGNFDIAALIIGGGGENITGFGSVTSTSDSFTGNWISPARAPGPGQESHGAGVAVEGCPHAGGGGSANLWTGTIVAGNAILRGGNGEGAGMYAGGCAGGSVDLTLLQSTLAGNSFFAPLVGGAGDTLTLRNSIVAGSIGGEDVTGFASRTVTYTDACESIAAVPFSGMGNTCGGAVLPNAGYGDVHEAPTSQTIGHGSNADVPATLPTDFEGDPRIIGASVDMGVDEYAGPFATTGAAKQIGVTRATLTGSVNPNGRAGTYRFFWGPTRFHGRATPTRAIAATTASRAVYATLENLRPGHRYYYVLVASNGRGTVGGGEQHLIAKEDPLGHIRVWRTARVSLDGFARVIVKCPSGTPGMCAGELVLSRGGREVGHASLSVAPGHRDPVRVHLSKAVRDRLSIPVKVHVLGLVSVHDAAGTQRKRKRKVVLRLG